MNNKAYSAKVRFSPLFNAAGAKLYVAILENRTVKNVKSNGETEFFDVMKKMLPNENGTAVPAGTIGNWDSLTFNFTFNGNYRLPADGAAANRINDATENSVENFYNMHVIAWIQGSDKQVYQAANLTSTTPVGTEDFSTSVKNIDVFPNPTSDVININMNMTKSDVILATLVDLSGNMVESKSINASIGANTIQFNTKNLAQGIYNVLIFDSKNNSSVHKIVVQH
jgi:hypothetical protein